MHSYEKSQPTEPGFYIWRCHHKYFKDLKVTFIDQYRKCGVGLKTVMSPGFGYWHGDKVLIPENLYWDKCGLSTGAAKKLVSNNKNVIAINQFEINSCPFCKETPGIFYSGRYVGAPPMESEYWRLFCCSWVKTTNFRDPRELILRWKNQPAHSLAPHKR